MPCLVCLSIQWVCTCTEKPYIGSSQEWRDKLIWIWIWNYEITEIKIHIEIDLKKMWFRLKARFSTKCALTAIRQWQQIFLRFSWPRVWKSLLLMNTPWVWPLSHLLITLFLIYQLICIFKITFGKQILQTINKNYLIVSACSTGCDYALPLYI